MPFILPGNVGSATAATGFNVDNSVRFNSADSASMQKDAAAPTDNNKWTFSAWVKRSKFGGVQEIFYGEANSTNYCTIRFNDADDTLTFKNRPGSTTSTLTTTQVFRDVAAWYHLVVVLDTSNGTAANRDIIYINGVRETNFSTESHSGDGDACYINSDGDAMKISKGNSASFFDGYMAEVNFIDGQALAADSFGEFDGDSGIWKPIDASGLTFGNNGFYLDFKASGNLGNDANGGTDLTETNLAAGDQSTDTCTNNYNVLNTVTQYGSHTLGEGNTELLGDTGYNHQGTTFGVNKGKWYVEIKHAQTRSKVFMLSLYNVENTVKTVSDDVWFSNGLGLTTFFLQLQNTNHATNRNYTLRKKVGTTQTTVTSTGGNITGGLSVGTIGVYIDMDNKRLHFYNNGTALDTSNAASSSAGSGAIPAGTYALGLTDVRGGSDAGDDGVLLMNWNFGSPNANISISSGNTDANGYGNFEYSPTVGGVSYYAMNTKNLAEFG